MGNRYRTGAVVIKRGRKVSHKRRVELIQDLQAMRLDLNRLEERIRRAESMIKKDYWTLDDLCRLPFFKARLKD